LRRVDVRLYTGFIDLDTCIAGLHREELTILAGRPGTGKTAFALQIAINLAQKGNKIAFFSREMSNTQIATRMLANQSEVDGHKLRFVNTLTPEDLKKLRKAKKEIAGLPIYLDDETRTIEEIRALCRELQSKGNLDVMFVDYLQLLETVKQTNNREQEVGKISRSLKLISKEFKIPVIALSQLNRASEQKNQPTLSDLRESGAIEQDADNVIFLHVPNDEKFSAKPILEVIVAKQRNGPAGIIKLGTERNTFKFFSISDWDKERKENP
jgi:replicative DNA helicase